MSQSSSVPPIHSGTKYFSIRSDELMVGGIPITQLEARVGSTPFYAYDRSAIDQRVGELRSALPKEVLLHYAMKANPMPAVVCHVAQLVDGIDVASGAELRVALDAGTNPKEISFAGPGKSETELRQALASGILINIESFREAELLASLCQKPHMPARIAIRVNPDFELKSSGMKMGGGPKQFGVDAEQVPELLRLLARLGLGIEGFHVFAGSQNLKPEAICEAQQKSYALAVRLAADAHDPLRVLNLGGGFGIPYFPGETALDLTSIGRNLRDLVARARIDFPSAKIVIELGRYIVGEAGIYVCKVIDRKISRGHIYLVADGGLHHHLAASGNFGQVVRKNYPVAVANRANSETPQMASVVGPLCTPLDLLADKMPLGHAQLGDLIVVFQSGAYGCSASPHGFLSHPAPVEVLV